MREKSIVFEHFKTITDNEKLKYVCKYCDTCYTNKNATKFARHIVNCKKCPLNVKKTFDKNNIVTRERSSSASSSLESQSQGSSASASETNNNDAVKDHNEIHRILSRAIYVTGQPLSILEHPLWKDTLHALRPDYEAPSRKVISTTLLNEEYSKVQGEINQKIQEAQILHLSIDGWSNLRNEGIFNVIIYTPKPYFYKFLDTEANKHTGEYVAEKVAEVIEELGVRKFLAVVSDNAANMKKCGRLLCNAYDNLIWIGCIAHTLHLLIGDILDLQCIKNVFVLTVSIVKCVNNSQTLKAEFTKVATEKCLNVSLVLPIKTRWGSYLNCLKNFLKSKSILQLMAVNTENTSFLKHKEKILSESTWTEINKHVHILKPIVEWITKLEGDYDTIHLVHKAVCDINQMLESTHAEEVFGEELAEIRIKFDSRKENALQPVHYAATILNPHDQGTSLTANANLDGCQFIIDHCGTDCVVEVLEELSDYKSRVNDFGRNFIWSNSLQPISWWQLFFSSKNLAKTAIKILSIPSTSASVERSFSTFSQIHTKKRNKLTTDRSGKLCFIAHNWKLLNPKAAARSSSSRDSRDESGSSSEQRNHDEAIDVENETSDEDIEVDFVDTSANSESEEVFTLGEDPLLGL